MPSWWLLGFVLYLIVGIPVGSITLGRLDSRASTMKAYHGRGSNCCIFQIIIYNTLKEDNKK
jgi:hypothetical protein